MDVPMSLGKVDAKTFTCSEQNCLTNFSSEYEYNLHLISVHQVRNPEKQFCCLVSNCDYVNSRRSRLCEHLSTHYPNIFPCSCKYCGYQCNFSTTLQSHIERKHRNRSKKSKKKQPKNGEQSIDTEQTTFSCIHPTCSKSFQTEFDSKLHRIIQHRPEEVYQCTDCDYKTPLSSKIEIHLGRHFEMKNIDKYKCQCGDTFCHRSGLCRHQKKSCRLTASKVGAPSVQTEMLDQAIANPVENKSTKSSRTPKCYPCKYCPHKVKSKSGLYRHIKKRHPQKFHKNKISKKAKKKRIKFDKMLSSFEKMAISPPPQDLTVQNVGVSPDPFDELTRETEPEIESPQLSPSPPPQEIQPLFICLHRRCQLTYSTQYEYEIHKILDHLPPAHLNDFECKHCRSIVNVDNAESHLFLHLVPTVYECGHCDFTTHYKDYLEKHNQEIHQSN